MLIIHMYIHRCSERERNAYSPKSKLLWTRSSSLARFFRTLLGRKQRLRKQRRPCDVGIERHVLSWSQPCKVGLWKSLSYLVLNVIELWACLIMELLRLKHTKTGWTRRCRFKRGDAKGCSGSHQHLYSRIFVAMHGSFLDYTCPWTICQTMVVTSLGLTCNAWNGMEWNGME